MEIQQLHFEEHGMSNSYNALRVLRDSLAFGYKHSLAIIQILTGDSRCGFLILDANDQSATFTGDGFSLDQNAGLAASAFLSAHALLLMFAIKLISGPELNFNLIREHFENDEPQRGFDHAKLILSPIAADTPDSDFNFPSFQERPGLLHVTPPRPCRVLNLYGSRH